MPLEIAPGVHAQDNERVEVWTEEVALVTPDGTTTVLESETLYAFPDETDWDLAGGD